MDKLRCLDGEADYENCWKVARGSPYYAYTGAENRNTFYLDILKELKTWVDLKLTLEGCVKEYQDFLTGVKEWMGDLEGQNVDIR